MSLDRWVRVLGPVDVVTPDGVHSVGGRRQRALLGALAIAAGRSVSPDELAQAVWGDDPPRTAANTLQSHVSHLRDILGDEAIEHRDHAYRLDLDHVAVDSIEFTRLLRAASTENDQADRWQLSHDALALWRGQAFGDLADNETFALEAYRLSELRLSAMEINLSADIELGRHDLVIGELQCAVREHPYHERLWYLLVDALVRSDRRVEALRACTELRRVLSGAGVQPGDDLTELERQILTHQH